MDRLLAVLEGIEKIKAEGSRSSPSGVHETVNRGTYKGP